MSDYLHEKLRAEKRLQGEYDTLLKGLSEIQMKMTQFLASTEA